MKKLLPFLLALSISSSLFAQIDSNIFVIDVRPNFPGGDKALLEFIEKNLRYPDLYQKQAKNIKVIARFVITPLGEIRDIEILRSPGEVFSDAAAEVLLQLPSFEPYDNKSSNNTYFTVPIVFRYE